MLFILPSGFIVPATRRIYKEVTKLKVILK